MFVHLARVDPQRFIMGIVIFLRKSTHGGDGITNSHPLMMLNTDSNASKTVYHGFLEAVLSTPRLEVNFCRWICLL